MEQGFDLLQGPLYGGNANAGGASFRPNQIPNCAAWYRGDLGITLNGTTVSAWADQSGNAHTLSQGTASLQPLYVPNAQNNKPAVRFDGIDDFLASGAFTLNQAEHVFIVYKSITIGGSGSHDIVYDGVTASSMALVVNNTPLYGISSSTSLTTALNLGTSYIYSEQLFNGASSTLCVNNNQVAAGTVTSSGSTGGLTLGSIGGGTAARSANIEVAEWIVFNRSLSVAEIKLIRDYLRARYAFTNLIGPPTDIQGLVAWYSGNVGITISDASISFPQDFDNAAWTKAAASISPNTTTSVDPIGTNVADKLVEDSTNASHNIQQATTNVVAAIPVTYRIYAKSAGRIWLSVYNGVACSGYFRLDNGTLGTVVGGTSSITYAGNGWWLCTLTTNAGGPSMTISLATADSGGAYQGDGSSGILLYGATVSQPKVSAWADQSFSGNHLSQATAANQPLYVPSAQNGQAALRFDGSNDDLFRNNVNLWGAGAYGFAICFKGVSTSNYLFADGIATAGVGFGNVSGNRAFTHQNVENHTDAAVVANAETWVGSRAAASAPTLLVDGGSQALSNTTNTVIDPGAAAIFAVGSFAHLSNFTASDIHEIICYNRDLTGGEQTTLYNYLKAKFGTA